MWEGGLRVEIKVGEMNRKVYRYWLKTRYGQTTGLGIGDMRLMSQLKYVHDNAAIMSGKKVARFYTISETQAARDLSFQYVNYQ